MEVNKIVTLEPKPGTKVECVITEIININGTNTYTLKEVKRKTIEDCHKED